MIRRLVVVDDDALLRGLLVSQLTSWGFDVVQAESALAAVKACETHDPDGVVLDVDLGQGMNGFQLAEALGRKLPHLGIVFLTRFPDARASIERLSPSLRGAAYVNKSAVANSDELLEAVNAALSDRGVLIRHDQMSNRPLANLTNAQLEVLKLIHAGNTNLQIASIRQTTLSAAENLINRTFKALGIDTSQGNARATAVRIYSENYGTWKR